MDMISKIQPIINNVRDYIGFFEKPAGPCELVLSEAVSKYSSDIYTDHAKLKEALSEMAVSETQITKIQMMTLVDGFNEILNDGNECKQSTINTYVQNAIAETGFTTSKVLELTAAICGSLGIRSELESGKMADGSEDTAAFVIPMSVYNAELNEIEKKVFDNAVESIDPNELSRLEVLAGAGITRAKYILGCCYMKKKEYLGSRELGIALLEEAAYEGDSAAAGCLGDYYYEHAKNEDWGRAYSYYTGYGALALDPDRRKRIIDIINFRNFNFATIVGSIVIWVIMLLVVLLVPAAQLFETHRFMGSILLVIGAAINTFAFFLHQRRPYANLFWLPCAMFGEWALYLIVRILA